ncbi:cyclophilin-like fold protein [Arthrobacter sp. R4-81]
MRLKKLILAAIIVPALPLAGCSTPSNGPGSATTPAPSQPELTSAAAVSSASSPGPSSASAADSTRITIRIDGEAVTGTLSGNSAARSLIEQLPLTLSFSDHGGQEKIAKLPEPLSLGGVPAGDDADPLTIGYYAPDQALVLYYEHVGYFPGIVRVGSFDDLASIRDRTGEFTATLASSD